MEFLLRIAGGITICVFILGLYASALGFGTTGDWRRIVIVTFVVSAIILCATKWWEDNG